MTDIPSAAAALRVLLVDADDRVRESLAGLLRIGDRCLAEGAAGTADEAVRLNAGEAPDVVVIDPRIPGGGTGAALIARNRDARPETRILVLTWPDASASAAPD